MPEDFAKKVAKFTDKDAMKIMTQVRRASAFDLFASVVLGTPVDKGVLRGNWYVAISSASQQANPTAADISGGAALAAGNAELKKSEEPKNIFADIFMTNNIPYGPAIEYDGHSPQAPNGMVRVNAARWDTIVKNNQSRFGGG